MTESYYGGTDIQMLALESPKPHLLPGRKAKTFDKDRYVAINDLNKRRGSYKSPRSDDFSNDMRDDLRDGAVNRTIETASYVKNSKRNNSKLNMNSQDFLKRDALGASRSKQQIDKQKIQTDTLGYEGDTENYGLKKKSKRKVKKKDILKDGLESKSQRPKYLREKSFSRDLGADLIPERKGFTRNSRDTTSYCDFPLSRGKDDETAYKRLTSANRPKSAGQARYVGGLSSDSDDSFYEGETEEVDLNDPVFDYEREFIESRRPSSNRIPDGTNSVAKDTRISTADGIHDNNENIYKQTLAPESVSSKKQRPQSDRTDSYPQARPTTSRGRRRAQSEPDVEPQVVQNATEFEYQTQIPDYDNNFYSKPLGSEKFYNHSMDRVISKYSGLTVKKSHSNFPNQNFRAGELYQTRNPVPRKLKPILRREKVGHIN